jgi:hypothetical protein
MTITISRDPFARVETTRASVHTSQGCAWCGNHRKSGRLFAYGTRATDRHLFCSKGCRDAYYD